MTSKEKLTPKERIQRVEEELGILDRGKILAGPPRYLEALRVEAQRRGVTSDQLLDKFRNKAASIGYPNFECILPEEAEDLVDCGVRRDPNGQWVMSRASEVLSHSEEMKSAIAHLEECNFCSLLMDSVTPNEARKMRFLAAFGAERESQPSRSGMLTSSTVIKASRGILTLFSYSNRIEKGDRHEGKLAVGFAACISLGLIAGIYLMFNFWSSLFFEAFPILGKTVGGSGRIALVVGVTVSLLTGFLVAVASPKPRFVTCVFSPAVVAGAVLVVGSVAQVVYVSAIEDDMRNVAGRSVIDTHTQSGALTQQGQEIGSEVVKICDSAALHGGETFGRSLCERPLVKDVTVKRGASDAEATVVVSATVAEIPLTKKYILGALRQIDGAWVMEPHSGHHIPVLLDKGAKNVADGTVAIAESAYLTKASTQLVAFPLR